MANTTHARMLSYFRYDHLPSKLQDASRPFADLAEHLVSTGGDAAELTVALRKLLEAKDAAVRAQLS